MKLFNTGHLLYFYCHGYAATLPGLLMAELTSLNLGEGAAVIATLAGASIGLGVGAAIAALLAPLIGRRFIWPAKDELCVAWGESIDAEN